MKKGISPIIATVLLIGITITLGAVIFLWGNMFFTTLAPQANCDKTNFQAGIYQENTSSYFLDVVNNGNEYLYGFVIKKLEEGSVSILEEINLEEPIESGYSYTTTFEFSDNHILIVPILQTATEDKVLVTCPDNFGVEISP